MRYSALINLIGILACVLYCAAYTVFCGWAKKKAACVCAAVLTLLSGGALGMLLAYII